MPEVIDAVERDGQYLVSDSPHFLAAVRVEQGKDAKQINVRVPRDLAANLMWFAELKSFVDAAHLTDNE